MKKTLTILIALNTLWASQTPATEVYRCQAENGAITFTRSGCPSGQTSNTQQAHNPRPSSGQATPMAERKTTKRNKQENSLVIVGQQDDGCNNQVTGQARREAMIKQQIKTGMNRRDVESSLGKPERTSHHNGRERFHYTSPDGSSRTVTFDQNGCVQGK